MRKIGILTSGGDSPGMNAAIRSVVRTGIYNGMEIYGIKNGYEGLINGDIHKMDRSSVADILHRGGTILLTARSKRFMTDEGFQTAIDNLKKFGIEGLVVVGGDGSFKGAKALSNSGIATIGIPGTIDNDLGYTDYTIGFDTAVNTVIAAIGNIRDTSSSHGRVNIVEVMGRHCGDIAVFAGLAGGAEAVLVPDVEFDLEEICEKIRIGREKGKKHCIIVLAEGVGIKAEDLAKTIGEKTGLESRKTVLGYIQRGGSPSSFDRILASRLGNRAVELLSLNETGRVIGMKGNEIVDYEINEALEVKRIIRTDLLELCKELAI